MDSAGRSHTGLAIAAKDTDEADGARTVITEATSQARGTLREDVRKLIEPHRASLEEPPFSMSDMTVIAIVLSDQYELNESMQETDIMSWIIESFAFYARQAGLSLLNDWLDQEGGVFNWSREIDVMTPLPGFYDALHHYDLPTRREDGTDEGGSEYTIQPHRARAVLHRWLVPPQGRAFRFLDLPPELRNRVYDKLFRHPGTAITMYCSEFDNYYSYEESDPEDKEVLMEREYQHSKRRLQMLEIGHTGPLPSKYGAGNQFHHIYPEPISELLGILCTCKQIYTEAKSTFYSANLFRFDSTETLSHTLRYRLHADRAQFLKRVWIDIRSVVKLEDALLRLSCVSLDYLAIEDGCRSHTDPTKRCIVGGKHNRRLSRRADKLDALVTICGQAKEVHFVSGSMKRCTALQRFVKGKLKQKGKEKMKCCSMMIPPKQQEETVD